MYSVSENLLARKLIEVQVVKWRLSSHQQAALKAEIRPSFGACLVSEIFCEMLL
jgi:hypothetical protein